MELRSYQGEAVEFLLPRARGFVIAPAGSGKTIIAATAVARKVKPGQHVVWLANTREQVEQGTAAIQATPGPEGVTFEVCCVAAQPESIAQADIIVVDEAAHAPAFSWDALISQAKPGAIVWGFSATPWADGLGGQERNDRLVELFQEFLRIDRERVEASGHLTKGKVYLHDLDTPGQFDAAIDAAVAVEVEKRFKQFPVLWDIPQVKGLTARIKGVVTKMRAKVGPETVKLASCGGLSPDVLRSYGIAELVAEAAKLSKERDDLVKKEHEKRAKWQITQEHLQANETRNECAVQIARQEAAKGESVLVLVHSIEHGERLCSRIEGSLLVHSKLGAKRRRAAIEAFRSGETRVLLATSLADEGLDVPRASRLILVSGGRSAGKLEQRAGRILRPFEGKQVGVVHDFLDAGALYAKQQAKARMRVYDELGYQPEIVSYGEKRAAA